MLHSFYVGSKVILRYSKYEVRLHLCHPLPITKPKHKTINLKLLKYRRP